MTVDTTEFPITIVSTDRKSLRELSWTLSSLGLPSLSSTDWNDGAVWQLSERPSLLLLDARDVAEIQAFLELPRTEPYRYRIAFDDAAAESRLAKLMDWGADDFIGIPANPGEVLTRVEAGLRRLEFERRLAEMASCDAGSGLTTGCGFTRRLQQQLKSPSSVTNSVVVALGIDAQEILSTQFDYLLCELTKNSLAECLEEQMTGDDFYATLEDGTCLAFLKNSAVAEGIACADLVASQFRARSALSTEFEVRITASGVVASASAAERGDEVVQRALVALRQVQDAGGNQVLDACELEQYFVEWQQRSNHSSLLREALARHIMEPMSLVLPVDGNHADADDVWGNYALQSDAPQPPCAAVVDRQGRLLGVVQLSAADQFHEESVRPLEELMTQATDTVDGSAPLGNLIDAMDRAEGDYLIVVEGDKPVGYVTREKLATLDDFDSAKRPTVARCEAEHDLASLVVPCK